MEPRFIALLERSKSQGDPVILDHYTIHTSNLAQARWFYREILGLTEGYRPPFEGPAGAWLYGPDGRPVVHLYAGRTSANSLDGAVDHIAFRVTEIDAIMLRLEQHNIAYDTATVPELNGKQVFFRDPDGIQVELNFDPGVT